MKQRHVLSANPAVGCNRLALVRFDYAGFDGRMHEDGEIVVLDALADHVLAIFRDLRRRGFPLAQAKLMNAYNGDDDASLAQNNTSAFNDRTVIGSNSISMHAYGAAIDINPVQNPYVERVRGRLSVAPPSGAAFVRRKPLRPGMAESVVTIFAKHGFSTWGGVWRNPDYQHFQIERGLAAELARLAPEQARAKFDATLSPGRLRPSLGRVGIGR